MPPEWTLTIARNPDVACWLEAYDNPMKPFVAAIRDLRNGS